jgi:hypothetical protein
MSFQSQTYPSQIYRHFRAIDRSEYRRVVRFYERNEKSILMLDFEEYFELLVAYTQALFEISDYNKHLLMADVVIQTSILQNISHVNGDEIYCTTLFQKAASHYNLRELSKAKHIVGELLKMNPLDTMSIQFLSKIMREDTPHYVRHSRAISIFLFLMSALLICVQVLFIKTFYTLYDPIMELSRNSIFCLGVLILVGSEIIHRWQVQHFVNKLLKKNKVKKSFLYD